MPSGDNRRSVQKMFQPGSGLPIGTTVYDAFPSLAGVHNVNRDSYRDIREDVF
jgi:hypothetical protein